MHQQNRQHSKNRLTPLKRDPPGGIGPGGMGSGGFQPHVGGKHPSHPVLGSRPRRIDDAAINEKLKYLEAERRKIGDLAQKYSLQDNVKVEKFTLLTLQNPHLGHHHKGQHGAGGGEEQIGSSDRKDRLLEYHRKTNERRKAIAAKADAKRLREAKALEAMTDEERRLMADPKTVNPLAVGQHLRKGAGKSPVNAQSRSKGLTPKDGAKQRRKQIQEGGQDEEDEYDEEEDSQEEQVMLKGNASPGRKGKKRAPKPKK